MARGLKDTENVMEQHGQMEPSRIFGLGQSFPRYFARTLVSIRRVREVFGIAQVTP